MKDIRIASPCTADWYRMVGDDRVRHCAQCNLNVYNFSAMTKAEVEELISNREGRLCARFYQRRDGSFLTKDCPVGFQVKVRRISRVVGAALMAILGVSGATAQTIASKSPSAATERKQKESQLNLTVFDPSDAVIAGAHIHILDQSGAERAAGVTDQGGRFGANLTPGIYMLSIESPGFRNPREAIELKPDETVEAHITLDLGMMGVVVEVSNMYAEPESSSVPSKIETTPPPAKTPAADKRKHQ